MTPKCIIKHLMVNDIYKCYGDYISALFISVVATVSSLQLATDKRCLAMTSDYKESINMEVINSQALHVTS